MFFLSDRYLLKFVVFTFLVHCRFLFFPLHIIHQIRAWNLESGRLFIWGENQFGQLSAGSKEVITKPSCVKEIKNLGYKVRNIAFGECFSVILTGRHLNLNFNSAYILPHLHRFFVVYPHLHHFFRSTENIFHFVLITRWIQWRNDPENNKVFFNGKSIFAINETYGAKFRNSDNIGHCVIRHNYEIIDFHKRCFDDQGNLDDLVDIVAGRTHFVVLTSGLLLA